MLPIELIIKIVSYLQDRDKLRFLSTCKFLHECKTHVRFHTRIVADNWYWISYYNSFSHIISERTISILPSNVSEIRFGWNFNEPLNHRLKLGIKTIYFDEHFDQTINGELPDSLRKLVIKGRFNQRITQMLPTDLEILDLTACNYNHNLDDVLPENLLELKLGREFNHELRFLPCSLKSLFLTKYNYPIKGILPVNLEYLRLGDDFDHPITECLPSNLQRIEFGYDFNHSIYNRMPASITHVSFAYLNSNLSLKQLPRTVTHLKLIFRYDEAVHGPIPAHVTHLTLAEGYDPASTTLSGSKLTHLRFEYANYNIRGLPRSLIHLTLGCNYNQSLDNVLHEGLTHLVLGKTFQQTIVAYIPRTLISLIIEGNYYVADVVKQQLQYLEIGGVVEKEIIEK